MATKKRILTLKQLKLGEDEFVLTVFPLLEDDSVDESGDIDDFNCLVLISDEEGNVRSALIPKGELTEKTKTLMLIAGVIQRYLIEDVYSYITQ